jgi:hypothetical protein
MMVQVHQNAKIEDPRNYGPEVVEQLRLGLIGGNCAQPDPHRLHLYELKTGTHTFYFHISPVNGVVILLARWLNDANESSIDLATAADLPDEALVPLCN